MALLLSQPPISPQLRLFSRLESVQILMLKNKKGIVRRNFNDIVFKVLDFVIF
jgi:hypothetical protein